MKQRKYSYVFRLEASTETSVCLHHYLSSGLQLLYYHKTEKKEPWIQLVLASETTLYTLIHFLAHIVSSAIHCYRSVGLGNLRKE